ncbi:hypothetical protein Tco_0271656 [Tanacetum coccineum]
MTKSPIVDSGFVVPVFFSRDESNCLYSKRHGFSKFVASSRFPLTNNQLRTSSNPRNQANIQDGRVTVQQVKGRQGQNYSGTRYKSNATSSWETMQVDKQGLLNATTVNVKDIWLGNALSLSDQGMQQEVPHSETYLNDMENQSVHAMQDFEQTPAVDFTDNEIHSDSNIIPYSQYLQETQQANEKANKEQNNESVTAELERYKERVKTFEQRLNIDLSSREKMIDSQMDDMIKEKLALKEQVFNIHFHLRKPRIKTNLVMRYVISAKHVAMHVIDDEETLILEEESRSKMFEKEKDPEAIKQNISHKPIDYEKLNRLSDDFGKRFTPQQELSAEQAFWLRMSNPTSKPSDASPVKIEAPKELPKVSLVNESLKKLKFHLSRFDNVVKIRTTPDARIEGEWGFEHTKAVFNNEIIPFLKSLKDIFNVFDRDLLNEIMEVQTVFDQMDAAVQQSSVDKQCLEIAKKELLLENDRLLQQIMSQDVLLTVMNSMSLLGESAESWHKIEKESCDKCFNLKTELLKSRNVHNALLKSYSQLEKHSQLQDKDSTICKLKDIIKSMREKSKEENVKYDYGEIETKNVKLENSVAKLISKMSVFVMKLKVFKEQFDSIKKTRVHTKEQSDFLIDKLNLKSTKNEDLKAQLQDKVFVITSLKNDLRKVKEKKEIVDIAGGVGGGGGGDAQIPSANTIVPGNIQLD